MIDLGYLINWRTFWSRRKKAYKKKQGETARRELQGQIKRQIQIDKRIYKQKIEASLASGNSRLAWQGVKTVTNVPHKGKGKSSPVLHGAGRVELANSIISSVVLKIKSVLLMLWGKRGILPQFLPSMYLKCSVSSETVTPGKAQDLIKFVDLF